MFTIIGVVTDVDLDTVCIFRHSDSNEVVQIERCSAISHSFISNSKKDDSAVQ
jgi:hypothetical protein